MDQFRLLDTINIHDPMRLLDIHLDNSNACIEPMSRPGTTLRLVLSGLEIAPRSTSKNSQCQLARRLGTGLENTR